MNEILILYILKKHDLTIYSLVKAIEELFFPYFKPSVGSISPILEKLSKEGFVEYSEKYSKGGLLSKTFSILPIGLRHLEELILNFEFSANINLLKEISAIVICSDIINQEQKERLNKNMINKLNVLQNKIQKTIDNPYLRLNDKQIKVYKMSKEEITKHIALLEENK